jgi:flagellar hook-basal body complex protein FliE
MSQGKTPAVIAKELSGDERYGYSPEEVYAIISRILESLDAYSLDQQLKLSILDLREMASEAKDNYSSTGNAQHLRGAVEALDKAMTHMEALQSKSEDLLTTLDQKQADFLVSLVERSFDRTLGELSARFPLVEKAELETLFRSHLTVVAREADNAV